MAGPSRADEVARPAMILTPREVETLKQISVYAYPREAVAAVMVKGERRFLWICDNAAPHPEMQYRASERDWLVIGRSMRDGWALHVTYHSHCDGSAAPSETDREMWQGAAINGNGSRYYAIGNVDHGKFDAMTAWEWEGLELKHRETLA